MVSITFTTFMVWIRCGLYSVRFEVYPNNPKVLTREFRRHGERINSFPNRYECNKLMELSPNTGRNSEFEDIVLSYLTEKDSVIKFDLRNKMEDYINQYNKREN